MRRRSPLPERSEGCRADPPVRFLGVDPLGRTRARRGPSREGEQGAVRAAARRAPRPFCEWSCAPLVWADPRSDPCLAPRLWPRHAQNAEQRQTRDLAKKLEEQQEALATQQPGNGDLETATIKRQLSDATGRADQLVQRLKEESSAVARDRAEHEAALKKAQTDADAARAECKKWESEAAMAKDAYMRRYQAERAASGVGGGG